MNPTKYTPYMNPTKLKPGPLIKFFVLAIFLYALFMAYEALV